MARKPVQLFWGMVAMPAVIVWPWGRPFGPAKQEKRLELTKVRTCPISEQMPGS